MPERRNLKALDGRWHSQAHTERKLPSPAAVAAAACALAEGDLWPLLGAAAICTLQVLGLHPANV